MDEHGRRAAEGQRRAGADPGGGVAEDVAALRRLSEPGGRGHHARGPGRGGGGIRINTIGFGDQYDEALLCRISLATRGRFVPVKTLRQLTEALVRAVGNDTGPNRRRHQAETSVLAIDLSASMTEPMEGQSKVAVVEAAVLQLLHYKQKCWS